MSEEIYKKSDIKKLRKVRELTPESFKAYVEFDKQAMADGALPKKVKHLMAIAVAHTTSVHSALIFIQRKQKSSGRRNKKSSKPCGFQQRFAPEQQ